MNKRGLNSPRLNSWGPQLVQPVFLGRSNLLQVEFVLEQGLKQVWIWGETQKNRFFSELLILFQKEKQKFVVVKTHKKSL